MKAIFWNVDTQYDFMRDDVEYHGKLVVPKAHLIEPKLAMLTGIAEKYGIKVINTADSHNPDSEEISANPDFVKTFPEHCITGTKGAEYVPATKPKEPLIINWRDTSIKDAVFNRSNINNRPAYIERGAKSIDEDALAEYRNLVITKDAFDVFKGKPWSPHAERVLDIMKPEAAIVYGVATNVCVDYAVRGLLERHVKVYVPTDAIKELPGMSLEAVLDRWKAEGAALIKTRDVGPMLRELYGVK